MKPLSLFEDQAIRPREKIRAAGIEYLSTAELFRTILGNGSKHLSVEKIAKQVTEKVQSGQRLTLEDLQQIRGMGLAKSCQILAALELVERLRPIGYPLIDSLERVLDQAGELRIAQREHILGLYLNARMQLVTKETLAIGSVNQSAIMPRDVFSVIKHHPVVSIILLHNHPGGDPTPTTEDQRFTTLIQSAGQLLGVELLDHVIISKTGHFSFQANHLIHPVLESS